MEGHILPFSNLASLICCTLNCARVRSPFLCPTCRNQKNLMCPYFAFAELQVWAIVLIGIFTVIGFILLLLLCFLVSGPFTVPPLDSSGVQTPGRLQEGHPDTATRSPMGAAPDSKRHPKSCITSNSFKDSCTGRGRVFTGSSVGRSGS